jgi:hypothetical protein
MYYTEEEVIDTDGQVLKKTIWKDGSYQSYGLGDKRHRIGGPALIYSSGTQEYWVGGIQYTEEQYPKAVLEYKLKQLVW